MQFNENTTYSSIDLVYFRIVKNAKFTFKIIAYAFE